MTVSLAEIDAEHDRLVAELSSMGGVTVVEDYGRHEENNELLPKGHPDEGGMWVREVRVGLDSKSWSDLQVELDKKASDSEPLTVIQDTDLEFGEEVTVRICCNEDA